MDESAAPAILQRIAARRRARAERRARFVKRLGVLLGVLAMPALAAETGFAPQFEQAAQVPQAQSAAQRESLVGSAPYYLTRSSSDVAASTMATGQGPLAIAFGSDAGPAAQAVVVAGDTSDTLRAQQCLTQAIYYEAASESDDGQRAVAQVVLNRVAHPAWPGTVCGVVYQGSARSTGCQFTFTCDGALTRRPSTQGWARAARVARAALAGSVYAPVGLSTHYHTTAIYPYWAPSLARTTVIGAHVFYRLPGAAGQSAAFSARYSGGESIPVRGVAGLADASQAQPAQEPSYLAPTPSDVATAPQAQPQLAEQAEAATGGARPTSGQVRPEYANAGRWIARP